MNIKIENAKYTNERGTLLNERNNLKKNHLKKMKVIYSKLENILNQF